MSYQTINNGTLAGDHTGEDLKSAFDKVKAMFQELYGAVGGVESKVSVTITAASSNDYDPGSSFPTSVGWLDINPTTNDVILTGLKAGINLQELWVRNIGSTYNVTGNIEDSSSAAANRFYGEGTSFVIPPAGQAHITYHTSPSARWSVG